ncbi:hypothetical protein OHA25_28575 [Nonomuraea sp. NBC_00507]|uniref:hypothetical protein n=1 Tax=Nonomuraea sp. NBC_00507 TaxID=2976002 RepID=UPI002E17B0D3
MSTATPPPEPAAQRLTRRSLLRVSGTASAAALIATPALASPAAARPMLSQEQLLMVLQVAKAGAVYPIEVPGFGESGSAATRASATRLQAAQTRLRPDRLTQVAAGADLLIARGLLGVPRLALLAGIGKASAVATGDEQRAIIAVAALGAATVARHFDPNAAHPATVWVGLLRRLHQRGHQPRMLRHVEGS